MSRKDVQHTVLLGQGANGDVTVDIELRDTEKGQELSICGNVWRQDRRDINSGGQIEDHILDDIATFYVPSDEIAKLVEVWKRWHLNGMRAACEHQRTTWGDVTRTVEVAGYTKAIGWTYPTEHPDGILRKPCEVCGYKYGTAWLHEELPADVIAFVHEFTQKYAGVAHAEAR